MGLVTSLLLGLILLVAVVGRVDLRLRAVFAAIRAQQARTNAATGEAVGRVQRRLAVGPVPVIVHGQRGLRSRKLVLDTGDAVLRLHLYGGSDVPGSSRRRGVADAPGRGVTPVFLTRLAEEPGRGWQIRLAGLAGTTTYDGFVLERRDVPRPPSAPGRAPRPTAGAERTGT